MTDDPLAIDREHILEKTADLWSDLRGARIFVTGGTGFVGTWLMEAFVAANRAHGLDARAVLLSRDPSGFRRRIPRLGENPFVSFVTGDATSFDLPEGEFDYVVHAATERTFPGTAAQPLGALEPDRIATRRVLDFAAERGVRRLLFTSSGAVYGGAGADVDGIPETFSGAPDPTTANAAYGESKRLSEFTCVAYARAFGFAAVIARLFAFVGPHLPLDEGYAVGNFIGDVLAGRPIAIGGDGTPRRSYLYAADMSIWLWTMLLRGDSGRAYNTGSPDGISIRGLADTIVDTLSPATEVTVARAPLPGAAPARYLPDTSRARRELGLQAWIDLPEALRRTYASHLSSTTSNRQER